MRQAAESTKEARSHRRGTFLLHSNVSSIKEHIPPVSNTTVTMSDAPRTFRKYKRRIVVDDIDKKHDYHHIVERDSEDGVKFTVTMKVNLTFNSLLQNEATINSNNKRMAEDVVIEDQAKKAKKTRCSYWPLCARGGITPTMVLLTIGR